LAALWKDGGNLVLGLWLAVAAWALSYAHATTPALNAHSVGVIIAVAATAALLAFKQWEEWVNAAFAVWLLVSPFLLGFSASGAASRNHLFVGILVLGLAIWAALGYPHATPIKAPHFNLRRCHEKGTATGAF
jgi:hypothetical protein